MLAQRVLSAHLRYLRGLTERGGGTYAEANGVVTVASPHPLPFLLNVCARLDPRVPPREVLDRAAEFFGTHGRDGYEVIALAGQDDDILAAAMEREMQISAGGEPLQLLPGPIRTPAQPKSTSVTLRWAQDQRDVDHVVTIAQAAHRAYGMPEDLFPTIFANPETVLTPDLNVAILELDGESVATAQVHVHGDTAYVGWVAVAPSAGRRGLGTSVTRAVVDHGFRLGAEVAVLAASPMGAPVYRRMGFEDVGTLGSASPAEA